MAISCITYDLDDTLWAIHPIIARAERVFHQWMELHMPAIADQFTAEALSSHRHEFFLKFPELHHDLTQLRINWLHHLNHSHGYPAEKIEEGFNVFWKERNTVELFDHAETVLDYTKKNFTVGAITNGNADLKQIGISQHFDFYLSSAQVGKSKPHPRIFQAAIDQAKCAPEQIIHVGDDLQIDVAGAATMGMKTIWVNTHKKPRLGPHHPDVEIHRIGDLVKAIEELL